MDLDQKLERLKNVLFEMQRVVVAFSGGVDSTFLLKVAGDVLGKNALAVTAVSQTYTQEERVRAEDFTELCGIEHIIVETDELEDPGFSSNPPNRCYYCKSKLFCECRRIADERKIEHVLDANNMDDCDDFRPGRLAAKEKGVRSPLIEAELTKDDIRQLSQKLDLSTWDMPAAACLASRFQYGEEITEEKLARVEKAEIYLREQGFKQLRVRCHGDLARIEVDHDKIVELASNEMRLGINDYFKKLGFKFVTVDFQGYRMGSFNETLSSDELNLEDVGLKQKGQV